MNFILILGLLGLSATAPYWGLCALLSWLIGGYKAGAHVHIFILGFPLFSAEAFLLGSCIYLAFICLSTSKTSTPHLKGIPLVKVWCGFYATAFLSALRGFFVYPAVNVIRDLALVYYSAFSPITFRLVRTESRLKMLALLLGGIVAVKAMIAFLQFRLGFRLLSFQPAAISLYMGCLLIVCLFTAPLWMTNHRRSGSFICLLVMVEFMEYLVRSSWSGMAVVLLFYACSVRRYRLGIKRMRALSMMSIFVIGIALSVYMPAWHVSMAIPSWVMKMNASHQEQEPGLAMPAADWPERDALTKTLPPENASPNSTPGTSQTPTSAPIPKAKAPNIPSPVIKKAKSFTLGLKSPNVLTRFIFWVEVVEEVFTARLPIFEVWIRDPYHMQPEPAYRIWMEQTFGPFILDGEITSPFKRAMSITPGCCACSTACLLEKPLFPRAFFGGCGKPPVTIRTILISPYSIERAWSAGCSTCS